MRIIYTFTFLLIAQVFLVSATCEDSSRCGASCDQYCDTSVACNGNGDLSDGVCQCYSDSIRGYWQGETCDECQADWYGIHCTIGCNSSNCWNGTCNGQGACNCHHDPSRGWWASAADRTDSQCDMCDADHYGPDCTSEYASEPTEAPVSEPTESPIEEPVEPTEGPVSEPTEAPVSESTEDEPAEDEPTVAPISSDPTEAPESEPTEEPISEPTEDEPTEAPISDPTEAPVSEPTEDEPTEAPISDPTEAPISEPTEDEPTEAPISDPTEAPISEPTEDEPTESPISEPTESPISEPTEAPTSEPTEAPTSEPTEAPTSEPTEAPTSEPTEAPISEPTEAPTADPLVEETTEDPISEPSADPTNEPTEADTAESVQAPSVPLTDAPSQPTDSSVAQPSTASSTSSAAPTSQPTKAAVPPAMISSLRVIAASESGITLVWDASGRKRDNAVYQISIAQLPAPYTPLANVTGSRVDITGLESNTKYSIKIEPYVGGVYGQIVYITTSTCSVGVTGANCTNFVGSGVSKAEAAGNPGAMKGGAVAGIIIAVFIAVAIIVVVAVFLIRRRQQEKNVIVNEFPIDIGMRPSSQHRIGHSDLERGHSFKRSVDRSSENGEDLYNKRSSQKLRNHVIDVAPLAVAANNQQNVRFGLPPSYSNVARSPLQVDTDSDDEVDECTSLTSSMDVAQYV